MRTIIAAALCLLIAAPAFAADQVYVHVSNGVVDNRALFDGPIPDNWPDRANWMASETADKGWTEQGGGLTPPASSSQAASTNPDDYPLQRYQFLAMLQIAGLKPLVETAIGAIPDPVQRAVAQAKFDSTQVFQRGDLLIVQLAAAAGLTAGQVDGYWMQAKDL